MSLSTSLRRMTRYPAYMPFTTFPLTDFANVSKLFGDVFEFPTVAEPISFIPATEIVETPTELILTSELPGLTLKDVELSIGEGVLTLKGKKFEKYEKDEENLKYHLWERSYGAFERSFRLPLNVDAANVKAEFADGVLKIYLPKAMETTTKSKKVEIVGKT